jgi:hypothetical protein
MGNDDQDLRKSIPEPMSKTKRILKWAGIISTGLATVLTPLIVMYVEVKPSVEEAKADVSTGYEAIVPAIVEIQGILSEATAWADDTDDELRELEADRDSMDERLIRCEAYIDILSSRRNFPSAPARPDVMASITPESQPTPDEHPVQQTAQYKMPKNIKNAKRKVEARKKAGCLPGDPLCGALFD